MELTIKRNQYIVVALLAIFLTFIFMNKAEATTNLNGIGQGTSETVNNGNEGSNADAVGSLFDELGVDKEATERAKAFTSPVAYWVNIGFAVLLSFAFIAMFFITGLDLVYIAFPPIRKFLLPEQQQGGGGGMMGMGGMGMGGMGMGGGQQSSGSSLGRWISDEALAAVQESQPQQGGGGGMMGGMMGMGMGGMGMGGGAQAKPKVLVISYFKKRVIFLVLFGICALLLSTTLFTDIGISLGTWVMNRLLGLNSSIPE